MFFDSTIILNLISKKAVNNNYFASLLNQRRKTDTVNLILQLKSTMSSRQQSHHAPNSNANFFANIKTPSEEDLNPNALFFHDQSSEYKPQYLELPIKIQGDMRPQTQSKGNKRENQSEESASNSEMIEVKRESSEESDGLQVEIENQMEDSDLEQLMNPTVKKMDYIDSIFLPYFESNLLPPNECKEPNIFEEPEVKVEAQNQDYQFLKQPIKEKHEVKDQKGPNKPSKYLRELIEERKNLLIMINNLRNVKRAGTVVMNNHKINKRDRLTSEFMNSFNILCKEEEKLQKKLEVEQTKMEKIIISEKITEEIKGNNCGMPIELAKTAPGYGNEVKVEESDSPKGKVEERDSSKGKRKK